ncbi:hypothetical protein EMIT0P218_160036 [Pseudomonas sp. IT-P218]
MHCHYLSVFAQKASVPLTIRY